MPAVPPRSQVCSDTCGLLTKGFLGRIRRQSSSSQPVKHTRRGIRRGSHQWLIKNRIAIRLQQFEIAGVEKWRDVFEKRFFFQSITSQRVKNAACVTDLKSIPPTQRFQRGVAYGASDQLPELHARAGGFQCECAFLWRGNAVLVGGGARREI